MGDASLLNQLCFKAMHCVLTDRLDKLESAVADVDAAAHWLLAKYPGRPLALIGFSFGGPAMWAATRRLPSEALVAGAASVSGSARGGTTFQKRQLDTVG